MAEYADIQRPSACPSTSLSFTSPTIVVGFGCLYLFGSSAHLHITSIALCESENPKDFVEENPKISGELSLSVVTTE